MSAVPPRDRRLRPSRRITVGDQFADDEVNFGPPWSRLSPSKKGAQFPRVVLDDLTLTVVNDHFNDHGTLSENPFHHELMRAPDGRTFVSYLGAVFEADDADEAREMLLRHRSAVPALRSEHAKSSDGVIEKYEWLASYHNSFCATFFAEWSDVALPDVAADPGFVPYEPAV